MPLDYFLIKVIETQFSFGVGARIFIRGINSIDQQRKARIEKPVLKLIVEEVVINFDGGKSSVESHIMNG